MITGDQLRMARAALRLGVREVAELAQVAPMTISRIENGQSSGQGDTLMKIRRALEEAGVTFPGDGCVCLRPSGYGEGRT